MDHTEEPRPLRVSVDTSLQENGDMASIKVTLPWGPQCYLHVIKETRALAKHEQETGELFAAHFCPGFRGGGIL